MTLEDSRQRRCLRLSSLGVNSSSRNRVSGDSTYCGDDGGQGDVAEGTPVIGLSRKV